MLRLSVPLFVGALALAAALLGPLAAHADGPPATPTQQIIKLLHQDIDLTLIQNNQKIRIKDVLEYAGDRLKTLNKGNKVAILLDVNAFKRGREEATSEGLLGTEVDILAFPKMLKISTFLRLALENIETKNATYLIRPGLIEITTLEQASPEALLRRKVSATFADTPLGQAMQELSDQTGASVILDVRVRDKLQQPVTLTFRHDTSLGAALRMLADMAGLKLAVLNSGLYVTTPQNARTLQQEERRRQQEERRNQPDRDMPAEMEAYLDPLQRPVSDEFDKTALKDALQDLSDETGVSIVLDRRVGKKAQAPVTASFLSKEATLGAATRVLADLAGLEAVVVDSVIYVTTHARADHLRRVLDRSQLGWSFMPSTR
jgi:hypothetical protein